jgi:hypothetical protein
MAYMPQFVDCTSVSGPLRMKFVNFYNKKLDARELIPLELLWTGKGF